MISGDAADLPMKRQRREKFTAILTTGFLLIALFAHSAENNVEWPNWRGPSYNGVAENADPPVEWSEEKNVRWKTPLPGLGHSSPVVTGNRIFVTAAIPGKEPLPSPKRSGRPGAHDNAEITHSFRFVVLAIDRSEGGIVWETTVDSGIPHEGGHVTASLASASPGRGQRSHYRLLRIPGTLLHGPRRNTPVENRPRGNAYEARSRRGKLPRAAR